MRSTRKVSSSCTRKKSKKTSNSLVAELTSRKNPSGLTLQGLFILLLQKELLWRQPLCLWFKFQVSRQKISPLWMFWTWNQNIQLDKECQVALFSLSDKQALADERTSMAIELHAESHKNYMHYKIISKMGDLEIAKQWFQLMAEEASGKEVPHWVTRS